MIILGIDPGTATTGYGVLSVDGDRFETLAFDLIETSKNGRPEKRLSVIHEELLNIISQFTPHVMAIEKVFFATNRKTAIRVGQAQGVMLLAAAHFDIPVVEYAPGTIKKVVGGNGKADKKHMQRSLRRMFGAHIRSKKKGRTHFDNAADALAVALCHACHEMKIDMTTINQNSDGRA